MTTHDLPSDSNFEIAVQKIDSVVVLSVHGELDMTTAPQLTEAVDSALSDESASGMIVDLTDTPFLASAGMTVLIETHRRVAPNGKFAVVASGPTTARPLTLMGLDETLSLRPSLDDALAAVRS